MSARSLSLQAYRTLTRRGAPRMDTSGTPRPAGELAWFHVGHAKDLVAAMDIADRLTSQRSGLSILMTVAAEYHHLVLGADGNCAVICLDAPDEHPRAVTAFLDHWRPDIGIWMWGGLRPNLVDETARRKIPLHLVAAETAGFDGRRDRWLPELSKHLLRSFQSVSAQTDGTRERLVRLGLSRDAIRLQPELRPTGRVLPCEISDLDDMAQHLAGRPVWLAARLQPSEWGDVLSAHRSALKTAHRLLLVIEPASDADLKELQAVIDRFELDYGTWGDGDWPEEAMQVLVADIPGELGLWYRLATVTFLGGSLQPGHGGTDPMTAAALGTAILYGPNVARNLSSYSRLASAGAARIVNDAASLASAVGRLVAPDQAATMAHAGWDVASEGAEVVDNIIDLVQNALDERAAAKERT